MTRCRKQSEENRISQSNAGEPVNASTVAPFHLPMASLQIATPSGHRPLEARLPGKITPDLAP
jgi:hypothetical protein